MPRGGARPGAGRRRVSRRVGVRVPLEYLALLEQLAASTGTNRHALMRRAIVEWVDCRELDAEADSCESTG